MFGIGMTELMVILVIGLLVIGPKKLPGLARSLGKSLAEFRRASDDMRREFLDVSQSAQIDPAFENPRDANAESAPGATAETSSDSAPDSAPDSQTDSETESGTDTRTDAKTDVTAKADDGG